MSKVDPFWKGVIRGMSAGGALVGSFCAWLVILTGRPENLTIRLVLLATLILMALVGVATFLIWTLPLEEDK